MARPHSRCSGFGRLERILVPSPAARTRAVSERDVIPSFLTPDRRPARSGGEDSNPEDRARGPRRGSAWVLGVGPRHLAPGRGLEPLKPGPKPGVLPITPPRKVDRPYRLAVAAVRHVRCAQT